MRERALYVDCFSGISGDMTVAALLDLGCDGEMLKAEIAKLDLGEAIRLSWRKVDRTGISATKFDIELGEPKQHGADHPHRSHRDIIEIIHTSALGETVKKRALAIFARIAEAEGKVHGVSPDEVHFHEVGAVDSIIDIVSAAVLLDSIAPDIVISSPVTLGFGRVETMHGNYPVPAPATLEILRGAPVRAGALPGEFTTPTGAGFLAASVGRWEPLPAIEVESIGYGAGTKESDSQPNVLRLIVGTLVESGPRHGHGRERHHDHAHDHNREHHHDGHVDGGASGGPKAGHHRRSEGTDSAAAAERGHGG